MQWFSRNFSFDEPLWMFPNILERLRGTPIRLRALTNGLSYSALTCRIGDRWSIQENIGHLLDLEPLWLGRVNDILDGLPVMRPADLTNRRTHEARHNEVELPILIASFDAERSRLVDEFASLGDSEIVLASDHPRLEQPMRIIDLAFFVAEHDDHHLAQISRLKTALL